MQEYRKLPAQHIYARGSFHCLQSPRMRRWLTAYRGKYVSDGGYEPRHGQMQRIKVFIKF